MHLQHNSLPFLPPASCIVTRACTEIKFLDEKVNYVLRLFDFWNFFRLSFLSFSLLFAAVIDLLLGLLAVKQLLRKCRWDGAARCSGRKFCSEFFTQLFELFCAYLRLHSANRSDLGIIGKIFSSCKSWVLMIPILFWSKVMMSEVEESHRFVTAGYGRQRSLFLFHFLESDQKNLKTCLTLAPHSPRNNMKSALGQVNWMARAFPRNMSIKFSGTLLYTQVERGTDMVCETQHHNPPLSLGLKM